MPELLPDGPIDTLGLLEAVLALPEHLTEATTAAPVRDLPGPTQFDAVVVLTAGPVATAGELVAALAAPVSATPVLTQPAGLLPAFVSARTLVVVLWAGDEVNLGEVVVAAGERGATVVAVAPAGSALGDGAGARLHHVPLTVDIPVGRVAVGPLAVHGLQVLEQLGLLAEVDAMAGAAAAQAELRRDELTGPDNPAARLARRVGRTLPVVYGSDALGAVAARRWKRQVNLDAKAASFANALPDLGWDEISGWGQHGDMTRQVFSLVTLRHDHEPAGSAERMTVVDDLLDEVVHERHEVRAAGEGALAQVLDLVLYGDVFGWHLAQELEIDPGPTAAVSTIWSAP